MRRLSVAIRRLSTIYPLVVAALLFALLAPQQARAQFAQQGKLSDATGTNSQQGHSVAISADGNTAIVGGWQDNSNLGAAWVWVRDISGNWTQQQKLVASDSVGSSSREGGAVAISGDGNTVLVGGGGDNSGVGATWVWTRSSNTWTQQAKLLANDASGAPSQGSAVSLSADGTTALVGGAGDASNAGAAWVFHFDGSSWTQVGSKLTPNDAVGIAAFGQSVAISSDGSTAIIGGAGDNSTIGAAWIFVADTSSYVQQGLKLVGNDVEGSVPAFGHSVGISDDGNTAIAGTFNDNAGKGAATIFVRSSTTWSQQGAKLVVASSDDDAQQGWSVALSGDGNTAIVGGNQDASFNGSAWIYTRSAGAWTQQGGRLSGASGFILQGYSVAVSQDGNTAIVGGLEADSNVGAAWVFAQTPTVTSVTPNHGTTAGGTSVTIKGTGFAGVTNSGVDFDGFAVSSVTIVDPTTITTTTPAHPTPASVDVHVANSIGAATLSNGFTYLSPAITTVDPSSGPQAGGTQVTINGSDFTGATQVDFGFGFHATTFTVVDDSHITATTAAHAPGLVDVFVATVDGLVSKPNAFTYIAAPTVTGLSPTQGPAAGGITVTITGTNLLGATAVKFDTSPATYTVKSATKITAVLPAHAAGTVAVSVSTPGGTDQTQHFTYIAAPTIDLGGVQPSGGTTAGGTTVTITGTHFTGVSAVTFDGVPAQSFSFKNNTKITAVTPAHAKGGAEVDVVTPGGSTAPNGGVFTFLPPPVITSISRTSGPLAGGGSVTINGSGFSSVFNVRFGSTDAAFNFVRDDKITATIPAHPAGTVDLSVKTLAGTASTNFAYFAAPTVTAINPNTGLANGGTLVSIVGTNLTGATAVKFGAKAATSFSVSSATTATATAPAHGAGAVDVSVVTPGGSSAAAAGNTFTYTPTPKLTYLAQFTGGANDGGKPYGWLVADSNGVLYGTTSIGGTANQGTVFSLTPGKTAKAAWKKKILHSFSGADGATPYAGLTIDSTGTLYGTTTAGGAHHKGAVFKLTPPSFTYTLLYSFKGNTTDGGNPFAGLAVDANGKLYGATTTGGTEGFGTVFKMSAPSFKPAVLHSFPLLQDGADGKNPHGTPILDSHNNIYGTAVNGGVTQGGAVFKVTATGTATALNAGFGLNANGKHPYSELLLDGTGAFYGTTFQGGTANHGTVFRFATPNATAKLLFKFTGANGSGPDAGVIADAGGILFGSTFNGGAQNQGTVFKLLPPANGQTAWNESVMYSFSAGTSDGANPYAKVLLGTNSTLYGTTSGGGSPACTGGCGMVYRINY